MIGTEDLRDSCGAREPRHTSRSYVFAKRHVRPTTKKCNRHTGFGLRYGRKGRVKSSSSTKFGRQHKKKVQTHALAAAFWAQTDIFKHVNSVMGTGFFVHTGVCEKNTPSGISTPRRFVRPGALHPTYIVFREESEFKLKNAPKL